MSVKAEDRITLTGLNDVSTITLDTQTGLTLESPEGGSKVVIDNDSVDIYNRSGNVATKIEANAITLGDETKMIDTESTVAYYSQYYGQMLKVTPNIGLSIDGGNPVGDGQRVTMLTVGRMSEADDDLIVYDGETGAVTPAAAGKTMGISAADEMWLKAGTNSIMKMFAGSYQMKFTDTRDANRLHIGTSPDVIYIMNGDESSYISLEEYISQKSGVAEWKLLSNNLGGGTKTWTIDDITSYKEFLLVCAGQRDNGRVLASTVIPANAFLKYTTDHGNGAHQAVHNSTYTTGASYLGSNKIKLYETSSAYCNFYGR